MRKLRRAKARELREVNVPFILRHKLARKWSAGYTVLEGLKELKFEYTDFRGCTCCDSRIHQTWVGEFEDRTLRIQTEWGKIVSCEKLPK